MEYYQFMIYFVINQYELVYHKQIFFNLKKTFQFKF